MGFHQQNGDLNGINPLVMTNSWLWKMAIEIVSFPMKHGDFNHCYVNVYQRVPENA